MRVLVTGANGQLGQDLCAELNRRGHYVIASDIDNMDITDQKAVLCFFKSTLPEAVIHCAAYTATDNAEDEPEVCRRINAEGTKNLALACKELNIKMLYISTDYVFNGCGEVPFTVGDPAAPLSVYGKTKYEGECFVREILTDYFIVRISWVFGIHGKNFVRTMLRLAKDRTEVSVVNDQIGSPTYTVDLSVLLADMIVTDKYGTYHATNEGFCSWYDFACEIFRASKNEMTVHPVTSDQFPAKIKRPTNSRMDKSELDKNGFSRLPTWQDALARFLEELKGAEQ
ncbi:MAG: dTDP-4-dehydrorhamnose reductase [Ruminococcaceae bacterium]|nr:dTDP-4-dehydrorhamnose reductase [Oscillospiraceae bacterium]